MEFLILGPLEVHDESGVVALGPIKPRAVLAILLLHPNQPVSAQRIAAELWGEDEPADATRTVQVYVSRLRKALGDAEAIATTPAGYRLRVRPQELDAERFERGVEAGRRALGAGLAQEAAVLLNAALGLWRGPPLAELEFEAFAQAEIARLAEQRLAALEARIDADLAAGRHAALIGELQRLLVEHPTRERFAAQLMLALYRSGRQADALEAYRDARRGLVEAAGIEPGPELQRLHDAVLNQHVSLELRPATRDLPSELDASAAWPLVGRHADLVRLREQWQAAKLGRGRVVTVMGVEGIGKTRLAAELAGEVHRDGDDVRYVAGRGPPGVVLAALGSLRDAERPTLVVLDDADELEVPLEGLAQALAALPVLVVVCGRDVDAIGAVDCLKLEPLEAAAVRELAAGRNVPAEWLLDAGEGVPRRLHALVSRRVRREAAQRVDSAALRMATGRAELREVEAELADGVLALRETQERPADDGGLVRCPFKGLAPFDVDDAPYFFGRERLVSELVARLVGAPLLAVVGPSGSGKSSVVRAGLLPALRGGVLPASANWAQVVMRPGEHPLRELADATAQIARDRLLVLAVDQFEETFTVCRDETERSAFVAELVRAGRPGRVVVLAIRADHYGRCAAYRELSSLLAAHHVLVGAMRRDELRRAVERPALRVGLRVEPDLTDALVADVAHEPGALPMLSTALLELWQRRDGRCLRLATYEDTGGVRAAVARHAEEAFARLDRDQQRLARSVLLRLATEDPGGAIERRRIALGELDDDVAEVVAVLTDQRLLTISAGAVELAHEALLREWPRLRGWLEEDAEGRRLHRHLADAAREWDERGRDAGDLYRGARLVAALEWRARHEPDLNRTERAYLDAGRDALHAARNRRRRAVALGIALLATITALSSVVALRSVQHARSERRVAASRALATRALAHLRDNVALAGLLGLEAHRLEPTFEARNAILSVLPALAGYRRLGAPLLHGAGLEGVAISPDGRTLAGAGLDGTISLWDVRTHRRLGRPLAGHDGAVLEVAFSSDGSLLASGGADATVRLWDVAKRQPVGRPLDHRNAEVNGVAFSPNGRTLASAGGGPEGSTASRLKGSLRFWDVASRRPLGAAYQLDIQTVGGLAFSRDGTLLAVAADIDVLVFDVATRRPVGRLAGHSDQVYDVALSPDGRTLGSAGYGFVRLWDMRTRRPIGGPLIGHTGLVHSVAFSPDGRTMATAGVDATVRLWDVASRRERAALNTDADSPAGPEGAGRVAAIRAVALSSRGGLLASGGEQGAIYLWDLRERRPLSRPLDGHRGWTRGVAFTSGRTLASAGDDGTMQFWDTETRRPLGRAAANAGTPRAVAASPDGRTLAVAGAGGTLRFWDARTRRPLGGALDGHTGAINSVAFSADGETVATGGEDDTVRLWDVDGRAPMGDPLKIGADAVNGVAFHPDGKTLATAGQDGTVRVWDIEDRRALGPPLRGSAGFVNGVAFAPGGDVLASAGRDGSVWLWDVEAGRALGPPLTGHTDVVDAVAFSPDGHTLASAGADRTVRFWDVPTRRALGRPQSGHVGWVSAIAFDPDGNALATAGEDATVRLWDPILWSDDANALRDRVCAAVRRNLTHSEWTEYLPERRYHRTCPAAP